MITHIHGKLIEKTPTYVVVDVNGVGYQIKISTNFSAIDSEDCRFIHSFIIKEDAHTLFDFILKMKD